MFFSHPLFSLFVSLVNFLAGIELIIANASVFQILHSLSYTFNLEGTVQGGVYLCGGLCILLGIVGLISFSPFSRPSANGAPTAGQKVRAILSIIFCVGMTLEFLVLLGLSGYFLFSYFNYRLYCRQICRFSQSPYGEGPFSICPGDFDINQCASTMKNALIPLFIFMVILIVFAVIGLWKERAQRVKSFSSPSSSSSGFSSSVNSYSQSSFIAPQQSSNEGAYYVHMG